MRSSGRFLDSILATKGFFLHLMIQIKSARNKVRESVSQRCDKVYRARVSRPQRATIDFGDNGFISYLLRSS